METSAKVRLESLNLLLLLTKRKNFSFSFDEVDTIQSFFIKNKKFTKLKLKISTEDLNKCIEVYLGETFIHYLGGQWAIDDLKDSIAEGEWIINWGPKEERRPSFIPCHRRECLEKITDRRSKFSNYIRVKINLNEIK